MNADGSVGACITGLNVPGTPDRPPAAWLDEARSFLALLATRDTYAAQPRLWELGEFGRARTIEDFEHHLRAARGTDRQWHDYLVYCVELFAGRGFPLRWLTDALATLAGVMGENLPDEVTAGVRRRLTDSVDLVAQIAAERSIDLNAPTRYDA